MYFFLNKMAVPINDLKLNGFLYKSFKFDNVIHEIKFLRQTFVLIFIFFNITHPTYFNY